MSVVVVIAATGAISAAAPILGAMAATAAAALGLRALSESEAGARAAVLAHNEANVDVRPRQVEALEQIVAERCTLHFGDDACTITVHRDVRGKLSVRAHGHLPKVQLKAKADAMLGSIQQQIAYRNVVQRMKGHGFVVAAEQRLADGTAKLQLTLKR